MNNISTLEKDSDIIARRYIENIRKKEKILFSFHDFYVMNAFIVAYQPVAIAHEIDIFEKT